ncbi:MAG: helix-turn-helix domain-containing protein [Chloroflexales bacterium]|nr:helix-turn-helix domain-containing protein [Chloroflexales bacterium]
MTSAQPNSQPTQPLLIRIDEAARLLSLGRSTVYELVYKGELPVVKCGNARRIPLAALHAWIDTHTEYHD